MGYKNHLRKIYFVMVVAVLGLFYLTSCSSDFVLYEINFDNTETIEYLTACFNENYTESSLSIVDDVRGLKGNVFKARVTEPGPGDTWWISGIKLWNPKTSQAEIFRNVSKVEFKYISSIDYSKDTQFVIQIVWKNIVSEMETAAIWTDFPIQNTNGKVEIFEIPVDDYTKKILGESNDFYLDWIMIGLEGAAGEDFNTGTFYIDDIRFLKEIKAESLD